MKTMMMQVLKSSPKFVDSAQEILDIAQQRGCDGIVVGVEVNPIISAISLVIIPDTETFDL